MQATGRKTPTNATPSKITPQPKDATLSKGKGKGKGKSANLPSPNVQVAPRSNTSARAGVHFGVPRIARFMKNGRYTDRIGGGAPVYLAATLQYICSEILELAGNET